MLTHPRQELFRLGILYDHEKDIVQDSLDESSTNTVSCNVLSTICPLFVVRPGRPKRSPRHFRSNSAWRSLPLYLSFSGLSEDAEIARLLSPEPSISPSVSSSKGLQEWVAATGLKQHKSENEMRLKILKLPEVNSNQMKQLKQSSAPSASRHFLVR